MNISDEGQWNSILAASGPDVGYFDCVLKFVLWIG